jgi:hypothetical protein
MPLELELSPPLFFGRISLPATAELRSGVASRGITAPLECNASAEEFEDDDINDAEADGADPDADADACANSDAADADADAEEEDADTDPETDDCCCCQSNALPPTCQSHCGRKANGQSHARPRTVRKVSDQRGPARTRHEPSMTSN